MYTYIPQPAVGRVTRWCRQDPRTNMYTSACIYIHTYWNQRWGVSPDDLEKTHEQTRCLYLYMYTYIPEPAVGRVTRSSRQDPPTHTYFTTYMYIHILEPAVGCVTMRWLRLVGSLKLQVSFAEYRRFYRVILQKRPVILRSLLIVATR